MIALVVLCLIGTAAGAVLVRRFPAITAAHEEHGEKVSVIIPARNEATNLPALLESLQHSGAEILVVNDSSEDATADIAAHYGATVLQSKALPEGWTGKAWASFQGAAHASKDVLLFLDADVRFEPDGYGRALSFYLAQPSNVALSLLPFHQVVDAYEDLSLFFHLLMAFGAGGFGRIGTARLLGPCMFIRRDLYEAAGGHGAVRGEILENLHLAMLLPAVGGRPMVRNGQRALWTRMFPHGFRQLCESWTKAFATGAGVTPKTVLVISVAWLAGGMAALQVAALGHGTIRWIGIAAYLIFAAQLWRAARQIGSYRWWSIVFYPIPLVFYFVVFAYSGWRRIRRQPVTWRGRQV